MKQLHKIARRFYRYTVDIINNREISGWAFNRFRANTPLKLQFYGDNHKLGETLAAGERSDVQQRGVHPTGRCGYRFSFPVERDISEFRTLSIRTGLTGTPLYSVATADIPRVVGLGAPRVLFMHIPKTAGTSFNTFARSHYPQDLAVVHIEAQDSRYYPQYNKQYRFVSGHLGLAKLRQHFDLEEFALYSIVREPYSHLHSHFNWVRSIAQVPNSGFASSHPQVILEMAQTMQKLELSDPQVLNDFVQALHGFGLDFFDNMQTRYFLDGRPHRVTPAHLDEAVHNLGCFSKIGLTEQYELFAETFARRIGADYCAQKSTFNRARGKALFDYHQADIRRILLPLLETDLQLYEVIRARSQ